MVLPLVRKALRIFGQHALGIGDADNCAGLVHVQHRAVAG